MIGHMAIDAQDPLDLARESLEQLRDSLFGVIEDTADEEEWKEAEGLEDAAIQLDAMASTLCQITELELPFQRDEATSLESVLFYLASTPWLSSERAAQVATKLTEYINATSYEHLPPKKDYPLVKEYEDMLEAIEYVLDQLSS